MTKIVSFDIEIAKEIPPENRDWKLIAPLGISCAALWADGEDTARFAWSVPQLSQAAAQTLVSNLQQLQSDGFTIVTWNGCGFDFAVLAQESGMLKECADLALNHV